MKPYAAEEMRVVLTHTPNKWGWDWKVEYLSYGDWWGFGSYMKPYGWRPTRGWALRAGQAWADRHADRMEAHANRQVVAVTWTRGDEDGAKT